jgi:hypothetical protein
MINLIVPLIFASAIIIISYYLFNEWVRERRLRQIAEWFEKKQQYEVESKVRKTIEYKADYWDNFNTEKYVEFLEKKQSDEGKL